MKNTTPPASMVLSGRTFTRHTLPAIVLLLLVLSMLAIGLLLSVTHEQDRDAREQNLFFAQKAVDGVRVNIQRDLSDYAKWSDAYRHLHVSVDPEWAYDQENVGSSVFQLYGYQAVMVIAPDDRTVYSVLNGKIAQLDARTWLQGDLHSLLEWARAAEHREETGVRLMHSDGAPAFVSAAAITTGTDGSVEEVPGPPSVMLFIKVLDEKALASVARDFALAGAHIDRDGRAGEHNSVRLDPAFADRLVWTPSTPGKALRDTLLPLLVLALLTLALFAGLVLRQALLMLRQQERQYAEVTRQGLALTRSEERFRNIAEVSSDWLWEVDADYRLTYLSERFEQVTGYPESAWLGKRLPEVLAAHGGAQPLAQWLLGQASQPAAAPLICQYTAHDGRTRTCKVSARAIMGGHEGFRGTATDITGELEALAQIRYLALHDSLTGLANRGRLYDFLQAQLASTVPLAVLSLDLDRFKPINDHLGHAVGDSVLRQVAQVLEQSVRGTDLVARLGGDEFVVVLPGPFSQAELHQLCERIIEQLHLPMHLDGHRVFIGVSIGAAWSGADCRHAEALLHRADIALYSAKGAGRGTWRQYSEGMNGALLERRQYETALREAFHNDGLQICYMPRFSEAGAQLAGFEASLQWQHPQRGLLGWQEFMPGVQDPALLDALGHWILHNVCQQAATWPAPLTVSMVVLPRWFKSGLVAVQLPPALARSGLDPGRLIMAIGEEVMLDPSPNIARNLHALKALGVGVYIDKFGSRLTALQGLLGGPFDGIRFDRHLVESLGQGQDRALFAAMVTLGRSLGLQVAAEGIDTQQQFEQLRAAICDQLQGAFFGQALSGPEAGLRARQAP